MHHALGKQGCLSLKHAYAVYRSETGYYFVDIFLGSPWWQRSIRRRGVYVTFDECREQMEQKFIKVQAKFVNCGSNEEELEYDWVVLPPTNSPSK